MRDDQGYFERFKQSLYFARLQTDQLEQLESNEAGSWAAQELSCYFDAAVYNLTRALCFLTSVALTEEGARKVLSQPLRLKAALADEQLNQPSAASSLLQQALETGQTQSENSLADLLQRYADHWGQKTMPALAISGEALIQTSSQQLGSLECRAWHQQLLGLGEAVVDMLTEY